MPTCPNGHQSGSDDWCEVCGHRMAGAVPPPPPPGYGYPQPDPGYGPDATAQAELCPQCRTPREPMAPYCEECRWNFLTQQATYAQPPQQHTQQQGYGQQGRDPYEYQGSRPSQLNRPAEPYQQGGYQQEYQQQGPPGQQQGHGQQHGGGGDEDWMLPPPSQQQQQQQGGYGYPQQGQQGGGQWSATVSPDRDYFMAMMQRSGPEAGGLNLPAYSPEQQIQLSGRNQITIGRRRHSTGESPDVDLAVPPEDPGVSHQHAVLVEQPDGSWAVVDQNSTNGTTINGGEDPIQPYVPVPLNDGDRVHVGAWTTIRIHRG